MRNKIKYLFVSIICLGIVQAKAQQLDLAKQYLKERQLVAAKEQIDNYLNSEGQTNVNGWLLKTEIYAAISNDAQLRYLVPDGRNEAIASLKKATTLNKTVVTAELEKQGYKPLPDLYKGYVTDGVAAFNAATETKQAMGYAKALDLFKNALTINDFAREQGWEIPFHPELQQVQYNAAQSAINAGNEDAAILYSRQLANGSIISTGNYTKANFANIYQWMVNYYYIKEDHKNLQHYAAWAAKVYPDSLYFTSILLKSYRKTNYYDDLWLLYDKALKEFPKQHAILYSFCADMFTYIYTTVDKAVKGEMSQKLEEHLKQYIQLEPDSAKGYCLLGKYYFNVAVDMQKAGAKANSITSYLNHAITQLKIGIEKCHDCDRAFLKEAKLTLCAALKGIGQKVDTDICSGE